MGVLITRRAWSGALAASLAMHAVVASVLWSLRTVPAPRGGEGVSGSIAVEARLPAWAPIDDTRPADADSSSALEQTESVEETLPAPVELPGAGTTPARSELLQPVRRPAEDAAPAQLLPREIAGGGEHAPQQRVRRDRLLRDAGATIAHAIRQLLMRGAPNGAGTGRTGADAVTSPEGPTRLPSHGPTLADGNRPPEYPEELRCERIEGTVWVHAVIGADGRVTSASIAKGSGSPQLDALALDAVRAWRFNAAVESGVPVPSEADLPMVFRIRAR